MVTGSIIGTRLGMNGYFGAFRDPAISRCGPVPSPRPLLSLDGAFGIGSHFQPQFQGNISVCERTFFRGSVHEIHGRPMGRSRKRKSEHYQGHVQTKRTRIVSNASSSGVSFSLGDDSADLPWNCSRSRDGLPSIDFSST
ncbi:hypothetical protein OESDEN_12778 [Oesophagostomum dentatum]|uniref:Uncharacterized protein n=1 Tax=Oesophagostomum dentatum TaxID=61180 RepID=A0A0B1SW66_OESDE|nr:hypothetical protein OESDEN_12778 [Oesophagostomum dentatum]